MISFKRRAIAVLLAFAAALGLGMATAVPASAGPDGSSVYNYGPVGIGIYIDWNGGYDYVLRPGFWSLGNSKGMYVGPGYCVDVYYGSRYVWTGRYGTHSFAYYYNDRIYLAPRRC